MSDERIIEFVRSQTQVDEPPDLVRSVLDAVDAAPPSRAWFAPLIPALATAVAVAGVLGLAVILGQRPNLGPPPELSSSPHASEDASARPSNSPTDAQDVNGLTRPGDSSELSAVDAAGEWGTIRIERGDDRAAYDDAAIGEGTFAIEVFVDYAVERIPDPEQFGYSDWVLRPTDPTAEHFFVREPSLFASDPGQPRERQPLLGLFPGAVDVFTTPTEGWVIFEVPRREANLELELAYWPAGFDEPVATIILRVPGAPPEAVAPASP